MSSGTLGSSESPKNNRDSKDISLSVQGPLHLSGMVFHWPVVWGPLCADHSSGKTLHGLCSVTQVKPHESQQVTATVAATNGYP